MRGSPGFRFHDNENSFYNRDILHKREDTENKQDNENKTTTEELSKDDIINAKNATDSDETNDGSTADKVDTDENVFSSWEDWDDFSNLMEDVSLYPPSFGLFDRTILTRVQKKDDKQEKRRLNSDKNSAQSNDRVCFITLSTILP